MARREEGEGPRVVIIGAGLGGLSSGIALKQQLGFKNFTIYEKAAEVGGTWRDNTYPGCNSDTPSHWYSLSTELNPYWSSTCVPGSELQRYWVSLAQKHNLYANIVFHTRVLSASWVAAAQAYDIELEDVRGGARSSVRAEVLISAVGYLVEPTYPRNLEPGLDRFKGELFHSARWDHGVDFHGKRVAVVGSGASAAQFIPILLKDPTVHLVNFCRTASWFVDLKITDISDTQRWIFTHVPFALRMYRNWLVMTRYILKPYTNKLRWKSLRTLDEISTALIKSRVPVKYYERLIPNFPATCKRFVMDPGYLACLHNPNIGLNWDGAEEVTEDGIITGAGEHIPFDVIIFATGFSADTHPVSITGTHQTLHQYNAAQGGPTAYCGVTVPGFPNFYIVGGPNTTVPNSSYVFTHEVEINYALQLIAPVLRGHASSVTVKPSACDAYNAALQARIAGSHWMSCHSWFRAGPTGEGKNFGIFPGTLLDFWWALRAPVWADYDVAGGERWASRRKWDRVVNGLRGAVFVGLVGVALIRRDVALRLLGILRGQVSAIQLALHQ